MFHFSAWFLSLGTACRYDTVIEGVGIDRITANMKHALVDDAFRCTDQETVYMARCVWSSTNCH